MKTTRDEALSVLEALDGSSVRELASDLPLSRGKIAEILDRLRDKDHAYCKDGLWYSKQRTAALDWSDHLPVEPWMLATELIRVTAESFEAFEREMLTALEVAVDFETTGLRDERVDDETIDQIVGGCFCSCERRAYYVPVRHSRGDNVPVELFERLLRRLHARANDGRTTILFWHARFDLSFWRAIGGCNEWKTSAWQDGMLLSHHEFPAAKHDLKTRALQQLGMKMYRLTQLSTKRLPERPLPADLRDLGALSDYLQEDPARDYSFAHLDAGDPAVLRYACGDALATFKLTRGDGELAAACRNRMAQVELDKLLVPVVTRWEHLHIHLDRKLAIAKLKTAFARLQSMEAALNTWASRQGYQAKPNKKLTSSPVEISEFLFHTLGVTPPSKPSDAAVASYERSIAAGKPAKLRYPTNATVLNKLRQDPRCALFVRGLLELRGLDKEIGTYLASAALNTDQHGDLRAELKINGAATTGRFSSPLAQGRGLPFHGIPREHRDLIVARPGFTLLKIDFQGEELRIIANLSGDPEMLKLFDASAPCDAHTATARILYADESLTKKGNPEHRDVAKLIQFAIHYGGGPAVVQREIDCTLLEATTFIRRLREARPVAFAWAERLASQSRECGFVRTAYDRIIDTRRHEWRNEFDAVSGETRRAYVITHNADDAANYVTQGSGSDILKISMLKTERHIQANGLVDVVRPLLCVHDEILFEVRDDVLDVVEPQLIAIMESTTPRGWMVPLVCEATRGRTWGG